ncbi:MAG TPA: hypothetical protein DD417_13250, partial [Elusimicrobia bacterium]|nr:hypothetical protein [Elusimicrobiota bacterium]
MEMRLFGIGVAMGIYLWLTKRWVKSGKLDSRRAAAVWHSLFFALAGFAVTLIAVLSIESRIRFVSASAETLSLRELLMGLGGALLLGTWG